MKVQVQIWHVSRRGPTLGLGPCLVRNQSTNSVLVEARRTILLVPEGLTVLDMCSKKSLLLMRVGNEQSWNTVSVMQS